MLASSPATAGDIATAEDAVRGLLPQLVANEPYVITHGLPRPARRGAGTRGRGVRAHGTRPRAGRLRLGPCCDGSRRTASIPRPRPSRSRTLPACSGEPARYIPEVLDSAVGHNVPTPASTSCGEHTYESPEAYPRYMCHPYHICMLDRYLLPESPRVHHRASAPSADAGLTRIRDRRRAVPTHGGIRRLVAMKAASPSVGDASWRSSRSGLTDATLRLSAASRSSPRTRWASSGSPTDGRTSGSRRYDDNAAMRRSAQRRGRPAQERSDHRAGSTSTTAMDTSRGRTGGRSMILLVERSTSGPTISSRISPDSRVLPAGRAAERGMELSWGAGTPRTRSARM